MCLSAALWFFLLLPLATASGGQKRQQPQAAPLFASCTVSQKCEGTAVCRFNICLPPQSPVPVYSHGNRTFTLQSSPIRVNINAQRIGSPTVTQKPMQIVKNYMVQAPRPATAAMLSLTCQPKCTGTARCVQGACLCTSGVVYSVSVGCVASQPGSRPLAAVPIAPVQVVPQALPGEKCDPGYECTGGSTCSLGICACPLELVQQGRVCVSPTILGQPSRGLPGYQ